MADTKKLLEIKKDQKKKMPAFKREGNTKSVKFKKDTRWRRPKGRHSKLREQRAGHAKKVMPGFRTPKAIRGATANGLVPVVISSASEAATLDKATQGAVIGSNVGTRKRLTIIEALTKAGITMLNVAETYVAQAQEKFKQRKAAKDDRVAKKAEKAKKKEKESKKDEKKVEENQEEKKAIEKQEQEEIITKAK